MIDAARRKANSMLSARHCQSAVSRRASTWPAVHHSDSETIAATPNTVPSRTASSAGRDGGDRGEQDKGENMLKRHGRSMAGLCKLEKRIMVMTYIIIHNANMARNLDIDLVRTFVAVADHSSMTAAANARYLTQGAVSQQIKRLEDMLKS